MCDAKDLSYSRSKPLVAMVCTVNNSSIKSRVWPVDERIDEHGAKGEFWNV